MAASEFLDAALQYAALGWRVFPLLPKSKEPATKHGFKDATTDERQIREWWAKNPSYNVGIATGKGLCVVDVDDKPDKHPVLGSDMMREWEYENAPISETCSAISGTGGVHYYFDVGSAQIPSCQSESIFIDLRCEGGYIVAPPSIHPDTGEPYIWEYAPEDIPPAKVTDNDKAFIQWVYRNRRGATATVQRSSTIPSDSVKEGEGRNRFLYEQGCSARAKGSDDEMVRIWLAELNDLKCSPPLDSLELNKIVRSVCSKPIGLSDEAKESSKKSKQASRKFDHAGIADKLIEENGACFIDGMPAIRRGKRYEVGWNAISKEIIALRHDATNSNQREVHHYLTVMAPELKQSPPTLIAFENGVLDIETMELRDWLPDDVIPNIIPHDWEADAQCAAVDNVLLKMACGEPDMLESLMEVMGVCMYRSSEFTQSAILLGDGSNGKSTYIRMLMALLGKNNVSTLDLSMIGKQFHTGKLAGKLANLGDDISNEFQKGEILSIFKRVVDGNRVYTDVKGTDGFEFENYATLVFSANEFPQLADYSDGMIRRIFPIEFNATFRKTDPDFDPRIAKKVTDEAACRHMAVIGVMGLKQVIEHNGFTPNAASSRRVEEIMVDNDSTLAWAIDSNRSDGGLDGQPIAELYEHYREWCESVGVHAVKRAKFTRQLNKSFGMESSAAWVDGRTVKVFRKKA